MPTPRIQEKELLSPDEMALYTLSQDTQALGQMSAAQLRDHLGRARNLRDRARALYRRQVGRTRAATGTKRGFTGLANERSRQKAEVLQGMVEVFTQARERSAAA